jgi:4-hydroxy-2-oxoglutarate aldolase
MERNYKEKLSGIFPPCMTIFDEKEDVAYDKIAANIERYNKTKLKGYMPQWRVPKLNR